MVLRVIRSLSPVIALALFAARLAAQDPQQISTLRLAQELENNGDWEHAVTLYEQLHRSDPSNFVFFDGLRRSYTQLKEYDKAIALLTERLRAQPRDVVLLSALGGLRYDAGQPAAADSAWRTALAVEPSNMRAYAVVAAEMIDHRLYDQALAVYKEGRTVSGSDLTFTEELANLYLIRQDFGAAVGELLTRVRRNPDQAPYVQSRLVPVINRPDGLKAALGVVRSETLRSPENIGLRRILTWLSIESKDYAGAFEQERIIDERTSARGAELFSFGQRMLQERVFAVAADAFQAVLHGSADPRLIPQCRFGYARAMEELSDPADSAAFSARSGAATPETVLNLYQTVVDTYPRTDLAAQALFRIGVIRMNRLWDLAGALEAFDRVSLLPQSSSLPLEALIKVGEVSIAQNNLARARTAFLRLAQQPVTTYQDQAAYRLAELDYYEGRFDTALAVLGRFGSNVQSDLTNDALQLQYFILENRQLPAALTQFARADLLMRQRRLSESLAQFREVVRTFPLSMLVDDATMKIAALHDQMGDVPAAIAAYRLVVDSMQTSILRDQALYRIGVLYQDRLHDAPPAIQTYERLLTVFPNSLYAEEARRRIRLLRGDPF